MEQAKLQEILQKHKKWLDGDEKEGARAYLSYDNLSGNYLSAADLRGANLYDADLSAADLRRANLRGANLSAANLRGANLRNADLNGTDLSDANLRGANLTHTNLRGADLRGADLYKADLDFSCFPLWCGGLDMHIDDRLARQLLYHLLRNVAHSKITSAELKSLLLTPELISAANQFHRVDECGRIAQQEVTT